MFFLFGLVIMLVTSFLSSTAFSSFVSWKVPAAINTNSNVVYTTLTVILALLTVCN